MGNFFHKPQLPEPKLQHDEAPDPVICSSDPVIFSSEKQFHVFLSHDWGDKEFNHEKVNLICRHLQRCGLECWFDSMQLAEGTIIHDIYKGIDHSELFLVFVTKKYHRKLLQDEADVNVNDYCRLEFLYAQKMKTMENMVPIVMEESMLDQGKWNGILGMVFSLEICIFLII